MNNIAKEMVTNIRNLFAEDMGRLRKFITSHEAAFTILGAFIVFLGFVVREGYQQENKDLASDIGAAANIFAIRSELYQVDLQLRALRVNERNYGEVASLNHKQAPSLEEVEQLIVLESWALAVQKAALATTEDLYRKLPKKEEYLVGDERRAGESMKSLETSNKEHKDSLEQIRKEAGNGKPDPKELDQLDVLVRAVDIGATLDVNEFGESTLIDARGAHQIAEIYADWATRGSYVLFTLGWALGLMGKLLKLPALDEAPG